MAQEVREVETLHPYLQDPAFRSRSVRDQIDEQSATVLTAHQAGDTRLRMHVMCWWPQAIGRTLEDVMAGMFTEADARLTMAREYGFENWDAVEALGGLTSSPAFEAALDGMLAGNLEALRIQLQDQPELATAQSVFGHRATLLHYLGANAVESHRQRTPMNAVAIAELLIEAGADIHAKANMYGGGQTALALAATSAHPRKAGVSDALNRVLAG